MRGELSCTGASRPYERCVAPRWCAYVAHIEGGVGEGVGVLGDGWDWAF